MGIQAYAKEKGYVHLLWIIAVQILIISGLLLLTPNGNTITAYIAFASSVASLILAVVAIFYSIISNQAFYQHIGSLQGLAEGIQKESGAINTNLKTFSERAEGLVAAIADVPGSVDRLASTLDDRLNTISPVKVTSKDKAAGAFFTRATTGTNIALYLIVKAFGGGEKVNLEDVFSQQRLKNYVGAVLTVLALTKYRGVEIDFRGFVYTVVNTGEIDCEAILAKAKISTGLTQKAIAEIDAYFAALVAPPVSKDIDGDREE